MADRVRFRVTGRESRQRLDLALARRFPARSRSYLQKLIRDGHVRLAGPGTVPLRASRTVVEGETIEVEFPAPRRLALQPEDRPLAILHEDDQILVLDKPPGLVVHPGAGARTGTLVHALLHHCGDLSGIGGTQRPGIVHRLDKETSGVLVVAKTDAAHRDLIGQFQARTITKVYLALVWGAVRPAAGTIDVPIGRDRRDRVRISARTARPRQALTRYRVLATLPGFSWLELAPRTGRTHQIRVHLKLLGHPVVGDRLYGGARWTQAAGEQTRQALRGFGRLGLHALRIGFTHPATRRAVSFEAPPPADLVRLVETLAR